MSEDRFARTEQLFGQEAMRKLASACVAVFGLGGVGGYAVEALVRSGIGRLHIIDHDVISLSNLNRQIIATDKTMGRLKVDVTAERAQDINPKIIIYKHPIFYTGAEEAFDFTACDYVVDAIDTVTSKLILIQACRNAGVPVISAMGAGNKIHPAAMQVADIYETAVCPLAKVMRRELRKRGIDRLKVVYSQEPPLSPQVTTDRHNGASQQHPQPGSTAFVPAVAGLLLAGEVVKDLIGLQHPKPSGCENKKGE
jgi:tRNA A37 threonylcarbamoyladenosine dehydratase